MSLTSFLTDRSDPTDRSNTLSCPLTKQRHRRFAFAVLGGVKRPPLDIERGLRADAHRREDRRMQVADRDRILDRQTWPLRRGFAKQKSLFHSAAKHHDRRGT